MASQITIDSRFHGPPASGNGGYVCGLLARFIDGPTEVTLRRPAPLDRPLEVARADGVVRLLDGDTLIAEAVPAAVDIALPQPVSFEEAQAASQAYPGLRSHPFPECFVCGPQRREGDGLRLFSGPLPGSDVTAAPWVPPASLAGPDGHLSPEFVWAALDCPSGWSLSAQMPGRHAVLGRLAARLTAPVVPGDRYVVLAWPLGFEGRKGFAGAALFSAGGRLHAAARSTWVRLD
ncbi:MAG TPA: hotdog fold domain-containing protein [Dehalococcoidia bacterium]|nr:hotdog fold domain-containing protein [Dehalococcoidia bacterium]